MNKRILKQIHSLKYPMAVVMAQEWFLSTKCRHAVRGRGLLRTLEGDLA